MDDFVHEPLDLSKPTIRLLRLLRGQHGPIRCEIFHTRLDTKGTRVAYEALSYVWGSAELNHEVFVAGRRLRITTNLHVALVQLRSQVSDRIIWIDAVCIDQNNLKERGHQVQQMSKIYREAERVLFWLGPGTENTMNAMLYLQWLRVKVDQVEAHEQFRDILEMGDQNQLELRRRIASKLTDAHGFNPYDSDSHNFNLYDSEPNDSEPNDSEPNDSEPNDSEPNDSEPYDGDSYDSDSDDSDSDDSDSDDSDSDDSDSHSLEARMKWEWPWDHEQGFQELLLVPWFQRVWILQEVANASAALVCCGSISIPADTFCLLFPLVFEYFPSPTGTRIVYGSKYGIGTHIQGIIDMMPSPFKTIRNSVGFYHLLQRFGDSQATDPRDIVYGMRGLSGDSEHPDFPPTDYGITEAQLAMRISQFMFHHDLTNWARLSTMSDLVKQLEWLLSAAISIHLDTTFCQNLVQLVPDGIVQLTDKSMRIPLETGHWRRIPEIIRLSNGRFVRFQSSAVIAAFRRCDLTVARCLMNVSRPALADLLYAALQNQTFGPELIRELFKGRGKEGRRRVSNYACNLLCDRFPSRFELGGSAFYANCLAAVLKELLRGRRVFDIQLDWCDKNTQTLLGYASKTGDAALLDALLNRGASVDRWSEGHTPLMLVAMNRNEYTAPLMVKLLQADADIGLKTAGEGLSSMDLARRHGNDVAVEILTACAQLDALGQSRVQLPSYLPSFF